MRIVTAPAVDIGKGHSAVLPDEPGALCIVTSRTESGHVLDKHPLLTASVWLMAGTAATLGKGFVNRRLLRALPHGLVTAEAESNTPILEQRWMPGAMALVASLALALADRLVGQVRVRVEGCTVVALGTSFLRRGRKKMLSTGDVGIVAGSALACLEWRVQVPLELPRGPREIVAILADLIRRGSRVDGVVTHTAVAVLEGGMGLSEQE
jgi:hypothetical protein